MVSCSSPRLLRNATPSSTTTTTTTKPIHHYNTLIKSLSLLPTTAKRAILLYSHIRSTTALSPDSYTFPFLLKAVINLSNLQLGTQIHSQSITFGLHSNPHVSTALIQMYSKCGSADVSYARKVFDEMTHRDLASWNAIIAAYAQLGDVENTKNIFEGMPQKNVISWTSVITGCVRGNKASEAIYIFRKMIISGVDPDEVAMLAVVTACARLGALELGKWVHNYIVKKGLHTNFPINNAIIDMYAKSGDMGMALEVFEKMDRRCVVTWTTIIGGLAAHGMGREALEMFSRMERDTIKPNEITFIAILSACSHVGLVKEGRWFFKIMEMKFGIKPRIEHYGCMVDLLGRCGCLKEAEELVNKMSFQANAAIWGSLLASSRIYGDVTLGEKSLRNLIKLEPDNSGNYMLLSNMYASHGWRDASAITRKMMKDVGVKKAPGSSSIEVDDKFHEFSSGEKSHPQFEIVYEVLFQIAEQMISSNEISEEQLMISSDAP